MFSPPPFADLGKSAKDLFGKGYAHGFVKFDSTTKSGSSVEFKTGASHNLSSQKLGGNVEVKYKIPDYGFTITEKWNTDNTLGTVIEIKDQVRKGLKLTLDTGYTPHNGKRSAILKSEWTGQNLKINGDVNVIGGPVFNLAGVVLFKQDWLVGAQAKFDLASNELKNSNIAFGRQTPEYTLHSYTNDGREFGASFYHRVHKNLELGAQLAWTVGDQSTRFGLASKYRINNELTLQAKVDNKSQVAVSAIHDLSHALKLTLSTHFGLINTPEPSTKFGLGLEYKPCC